ncbi:hypothetical protein LCGC14_1484180 [marine sediment metagenome]|uniref:GSCFA domain-containing protein n=1 Tax=marine sediment metagenome TaxID=412755 RepID=A0A0F9MAF6_9ZZZZ
MNVYAWRPRLHDSRHSQWREVYRVTPTAVWPRGPSYVGRIVSNRKPSFQIDNATALFPVGSCFAENIAVWLRGRGYNVLTVAGKPDPGSCGVFNTYSLVQELRRAFVGFAPEVPYWEFQSGGKTCWVDPHRYRIAYDSADGIAEEIAAYNENLRRCFEQAEVFIFTAGQVEYWQNRSDGSVYAYTPTPSALDFDRDECHVASYEENLDNLCKARAILKENNPGVQLIVTVSPVCLEATFQQGKTAIEAGIEAKCILRAAVGAFADLFDDVSYFPAYEIVMNHTRLAPFKSDNRHVTPAGVEEVMEAFAQKYVV